MATSLQRLIIMVLVLDLMLIMVGSFAYSTNQDYIQTQEETRVETYTNWTNSFHTNINTETDDESRLQLNPTFGDAKSSGKSMWELFKNGISISNYGSCLGEDCTYNYVYWVVAGVGLFVVIVHLLLAMEVYFLIINKKYT